VVQVGRCVTSVTESLCGVWYLVDTGSQVHESPPPPKRSQGVVQLCCSRLSCVSRYGLKQRAALRTQQRVLRRCVRVSALLHAQAHKMRALPAYFLRSLFCFVLFVLFCSVFCSSMMTVLHLGYASGVHGLRRHCSA